MAPFLVFVVAGSVSVGQLVGEEEVVEMMGTGGEEEVVEMMGTGGADELAQLNPSGHVWHVRCPSNEYFPWGHGC